MLDATIPPRLQQMIRNELAIGESVVWSGMPARTFFAPQAIASFLFGIPWTAFALFWTGAAGIGTFSISGGLSIINLFPLFGIPFVLIGFAMLSAPLVSYLKAGKTAYVITDRRAITFEGGRSSVVRSYSPEKLQEIYRKEKSNGSGDVIIVHQSWKDSDGDRQKEELGFLRIQNAKLVEGKLKDLASRADKDRLRESRQIDESASRIYS